MESKVINTNGDRVTYIYNYFGSTANTDISVLARKTFTPIPSIKIDINNI